MIYIPTITSKVRGEYENVLYSPNKKHPQIIMGKNITIWDNYTFYLYKRYRKRVQGIQTLHRNILQRMIK